MSSSDQNLISSQYSRAVFNIQAQEGFAAIQEAYSGISQISILLTDISGKKECFKQNRDGSWFTTLGWKLREEEKDDIHPNGWRLYHPNGVVVQVLPSIIHYMDALGGEWFHYHQRTGRSGRTDMDIKFGPVHFPEGTKFEVFNNVLNRSETKVLTVDYIKVIGARNYCIVAKELNKPDEKILGRGNVYPFTINICHVKRVISRGSGKLILKEEPDWLINSRDLSTFLLVTHEDASDYFKSIQFPLPKVRKNEHVLGSGLDVAVLEIIKELGTHEQTVGKWFDEGAFNTFLKSQRLGYTGVLIDPNGHLVDTYPVLNVKRTRKWLMKNQHRIFHSLDYSQKEEENESERHGRALGNLSWY